jgi:hypothetical protein
MSERPSDPILEAWSARVGVAFVWSATTVIAQARCRGAWRAVLRSHEDDDWITVHRRDDGRYVVELVAGAGHVEVRDVDVDGLEATLDGAHGWFDGWRSFMREGPGRGH